VYLEDPRQVGEALATTVNWLRPLALGVCSASLMAEAERSHRERKALMARDRALSQGPEAVESRAEEAEAAVLLHSLEVDLGYDFSLGEA